MQTLSRFVIFVSLPAILAGCAQQPTTAIIPPYPGPTETMSQLVNEINNNNQKIPTLWARHYYEATIVDEKHQPHFVNGDGVLLYEAPQDMRLVGTKELIGSVFEIGSNQTRYWLKVVPDVDTLWTGLYKDLTEEALDRARIPIRPDMVVQVLGISSIDPNFNDLPAPTMRFNPDMRMYMFVWNAKLPDRWVAQREVWYDLKERRPRLVFLFDANGRVVLRASLEKYQQIQVEDQLKAQWPWIATDYKLYFPDSGSKMRFTFSDFGLHSPDNPLVPGPRSFISPDPRKPGVSHVIEIQ
jgi:hypothetical protein